MRKQHVSDEVNAAVIRLCDAICSWERSTGREAIVIILGDDGYEHLSISGKPAGEMTSIQDMLDFMEGKRMEISNATL